MLEKIIYVKRPALSLAEHFKLEFLGNRNILEYTGNKSDVDNIQIESVPDKLIKEYLNKLFMIIDEWEETYIDNSIIDGTEWELQIIYTNGKIKKYIGKNDFPYNFEYFDIIKNELLDKIKI